MENNDSIFDRKLKAMLEDAEEPVPEAVWNNISHKLDIAPVPVKKKTFPIWWTVSIASVAAAILAGIFIFQQPEQTGTQPRPDTFAQYIEAEDGTENPSEKIAVLKEGCLPEMKEGLAIQAPAAIAMNLTETVFPEETVIPEETAIPEETSQLTEPGSSEEPSGNVQDEATEVGKEDLQAEMGKDGENLQLPDGLFDTEDTRKDRKTARNSRMAFNIYGNMMAGPNDPVTVNRPMMTKPSAAPTESCVTETGQSKYGMPVTLGLGMKFLLSRRWSLGANLNYTIMGREFAGTYTQVENGQIMLKEAFSDIRNQQSYIGLNLNAYFSIISRNWVDFYAYAGGGLDKCVANRYNMFDKDKKYSHRDHTGGVQFSTRLGVGVEFIAAEKVGVYLDPSATWYIPNSKVPKSLRTKQQILPALEIGIRVRI